MIEDKLREVDLDAEERGWQNGPHCNPHLFMVWQDPETQELRWSLPDPINDFFGDTQQRFNGNTGLAIKHLAEAKERRELLWASAGLPDGAKIVGLGLRAEALRVSVSTSLSDVMAMLGGRPVQTQVRFTLYVDREGGAAQLVHDRGQKPQFNTEVLPGDGVEQALGLLLETVTAQSIQFPWSAK